MRTRSLTEGNELKSMLLFSIPLILGNLLQQLYNVVDTLVVGKTLGGTALAAVGSSFTIMTLITSITLGFCMGSSVVFSHLYGASKTDKLKIGIVNSFVFIALLSIVLNIISYLFLDDVLKLINIPQEAYRETKIYLQIIFSGIIFTFIYNFISAVLRSIGNSVVPLIFLAISAVLNIILDIVLIVFLHMGVGGAAIATVIAQFVSAVCSIFYILKKNRELLPSKKHLKFNKELLKTIASNSVLTSMQQSVMNFGILMIQGLVNSFGLTVTAAFAAAVKIDAFAYMPVQDFGNALSTYTAQNYGASKTKRIKRGLKLSIIVSTIFCLVVSTLVFVFAKNLMGFFVKKEEVEIIKIGAQYLRVEGSFYIFIGLLFLLYGFYRGVGKPAMSLVLTIFSLGTRVILAYCLAPIPEIGLMGIWISIPIGWILSDLVGLIYYKLFNKKFIPS